MRKRYNITLDGRRLVVESSFDRLEYQEYITQGRSWFEWMPVTVAIHDLTFPSGRSLPDKEIDRLMQRNRSLPYDLGHMMARDAQGIQLS